MYDEPFEASLFFILWVQVQPGLFQFRVLVRHEFAGLDTGSCFSSGRWREDRCIKLAIGKLSINLSLITVSFVVVLKDTKGLAGNLTFALVVRSQFLHGNGFIASTLESELYDSGHDSHHM